MIKVVCIDNTIGNARHLELNKVYDASETSSNSKYGVINGSYYIINTYPYEGLSPLIAHGVRVVLDNLLNMIFG